MLFIFSFVLRYISLSLSLCLFPSLVSLSLHPHPFPPVDALACSLPAVAYSINPELAPFNERGNWCAINEPIDQTLYVYGVVPIFGALCLSYQMRRVRKQMNFFRLQARVKGGAPYIQGGRGANTAHRGQLRGRAVGQLFTNPYHVSTITSTDRFISVFCSLYTCQYSRTRRLEAFALAYCREQRAESRERRAHALHLHYSRYLGETKD